MIGRLLQRLRPVAASIAILGLVALPPVGMIGMHHGQPCPPAHETGHQGHGTPTGDHQHAPSTTDCCLTCLGCATVVFRIGDLPAAPVVMLAAPQRVVPRPAGEFHRLPVPHALPFSLPPPASIA